MSTFLIADILCYIFLLKMRKMLQMLMKNGYLQHFF